MYRSPMIASRSIPACAGEPRDIYFMSRCIQVYPRVRGGTTSSGRSRLTTRGLSPRARGNHIVWEITTHYPRSIPACAGEPHCVIPLESVWRVYPRVRGGTLRPLTANTSSSGLSPRARGNRSRSARCRCRRRSIPACAGEPSLEPSQAPNVAVYPRVRGGTQANHNHNLGRRGLSPRARGNQSR